MNLQEPEITVASLMLLDLDLGTARFGANLSVRNPNATRIEVSRVAV